MSKIEEILCSKFGIDIQNIEDDEQGLCAMIEYDTHRSYTLPEPLVKGIQEYAEDYAKIVMVNTRNRAVEIVEGIIMSLDEKYDITELEKIKRQISFIHSYQVLPEHY